MDRAREDLLVLAAQDGNKQAFNALFQAYNGALARFAFRLCGDEQLAHDAVQETWITLSQKMRALQDPRGFRLWAFKTTRWRTIDQIRRRGRRTVPVEEDMAVDAGLDDTHATDDQVGRLLDGLPAVEKAVLALFYLEELTVAEIAAIEEVPAGTVKSRLNRARARLRDRLEGEENE